MSNVTDTSIFASGNLERIDVWYSALDKSAGSERLTRGKVLQSILIVDGIRRVGFGQLQDL
jgi:hypothetical protein